MIESQSTERSGEALFPIRTVASLTGVNPVTLRAWERRYGLVCPQRTAKGHRLYSATDVERIKQILQLLDSGVSIGRVSRALESEEQAQEDVPRSDGGPWDDYARLMLQAVENFDDNRLERVYNDALALYPIEMVTRRLVVPMLHTLGQRWAQDEGSVAEEHFFGMFLRNKLGARFHHMQSQSRGPLLMAACLPGDLHELGLLMFSLTAMSRDYRVVLLGANTPLAPLPQAIRRSGAEVLVLSGSTALDWSSVDAGFRALVTGVSVPVVVGGAVSERSADAIRAAGGTPIGDDHARALLHIDHLLGRRQGG